VAPADADIDPESANIVWIAMAILPFDILAFLPLQCPWDKCQIQADDMTLLMISTEFEALGNWRVPPPRTPDL